MMTTTTMTKHSRHLWRQLLLLLLLLLHRTSAWMMIPPLAPPGRFTGSTTTSTTTAFTFSNRHHHRHAVVLSDNNNNNQRDAGRVTVSRRDAAGMLRTGLLVAVAAATTAATPLPAYALVKGVAPPPKATKEQKAAAVGTTKCTNVEECQAAAELREQQQRENDTANQIPSSVTAGGTRYRDLTVGSGTVTAKDGDQVTLYYKVLKLGKRSYDGLSGEGTVVFSRGYGFEDDESAPAKKSFITAVGSYSNIAALNEVIPGMKVNGIRRFAVLPQKGWRKPTKMCDGGPGGQGAGGDLKTDYVVVPTATMVAEEACFDQTRQPFPSTYAQQRRMAQRFDQSLCMEVQLVSVGPSSDDEQIDTNR